MIIHVKSNEIFLKFLIYHLLLTKPKSGNHFHKSPELLPLKEKKFSHSFLLISIRNIASWREIKKSQRSLVGKRGNHSSGFQRSLGFRAAKTSSNLLVFTLCGACRRRSGFSFASSAMVIIVSMNRSSPSLLSDSVGSIIRAPLTTRGKYMVGG